ncbi:hypothetical protein Hypma_002446 [Hypsizygus marmoreus]|uniref:Uncharacterized protein n=1 Tax=Hypsizygus marmoreus TaxID=39966 RepID=A0A369JBS5_HYPMA|nr:hypothetical protein Hypma_002446 [Hypsizygus marmoreus]
MTLFDDIQDMQATIFNHVPAYPRYYRALFIGDECTESHIVSVPTEPDVAEATDVDELAVERWIPLYTQNAVGIFDVRQVSFKVFTKDGVFTNKIEAVSRQPSAFFQDRIKNLVWYGNVLVVKHDSAGHIGDLTEEDKPFAEKIALR